MSRQSKLTDEFQDQYVRAISTGVPPETAARVAGASPATLYRYLKSTTARHLEFRDAHEKALAGLEIRLATTISRAALTDPRWALELLRQRFPARWARSHGIEVLEEQSDPAIVGKAVIVLDPAFISEAVPLLLEAGRAVRGLPAAYEPVDPSDFEDDGMPPNSDDETALDGSDEEVTP